MSHACEAVDAVLAGEFAVSDAAGGARISKENDEEDLISPRARGAVSRPNVPSERFDSGATRA